MTGEYIVYKVFKHIGTIIRCIGAPKQFVRLKDLDATYNEDSLITFHANTEAMLSRRFQDAWNVGGKLFPNDAKPMWRTYVCCWAAEQALLLEGDFVECGVNLGGLSRTVVQYVDFNNTNKKFFLFDTYCGIPADLILEEEKELAETMNAFYHDCYDEAKATFKDYPKCQLVKGKVPDSLHSVDIDKVSYLSIDMNCTIPEVEALSYFWPKLCSGALVVLDDYGWVQHTNQKAGIDEFLQGKGVHALTLPTGQGLIIKPN